MRIKRPTITLHLHVIRMPLAGLQTAMRRGEVTPLQVEAWFITRFLGFTSDVIDGPDFKDFLNRMGDQIEVLA